MDDGKYAAHLDHVMRAIQVARAMGRDPLQAATDAMCEAREMADLEQEKRIKQSRKARAKARELMQRSELDPERIAHEIGVLEVKLRRWHRMVPWKVSDMDRAISRDQARVMEYWQEGARLIQRVARLYESCDMVLLLGMNETPETSDGRAMVQGTAELTEDGATMSLTTTATVHGPMASVTEWNTERGESRVSARSVAYPSELGEPPDGAEPSESDLTSEE